MLYYLDTAIVICAVEGQPPFRQRAEAYISGLEGAGHRFAISELTRTECLVVPFREGNGPLVLDYLRFFSAPHVTSFALTSPAYERAAMIRGGHVYSNVQPPISPKRYSLADSLHLEAAIENGCDRFVTNDQRLTGFPDLVVEILP